jgi:hypothetical protein
MIFSIIEPSFYRRIAITNAGICCGCLRNIAGKVIYIYRCPADRIRVSCPDFPDVTDKKRFIKRSDFQIYKNDKK